MMTTESIGVGTAAVMSKVTTRAAGTAEGAFISMEARPTTRHLLRSITLHHRPTIIRRRHQCTTHPRHLACGSSYPPAEIDPDDPAGYEHTGSELERCRSRRLSPRI